MGRCTTHQCPQDSLKRRERERERKGNRAYIYLSTIHVPSIAFSLSLSRSFTVLASDPDELILESALTSVFVRVRTFNATPRFCRLWVVRLLLEHCCSSCCKVTHVLRLLWQRYWNVFHKAVCLRQPGCNVVNSTLRSVPPRARRSVRRLRGADVHVAGRALLFKDGVFVLGSYVRKHRPEVGSVSRTSLPRVFSHHKFL